MEDIVGGEVERQKDVRDGCFVKRERVREWSGSERERREHKPTNLERHKTEIIDRETGWRMEQNAG